MLRSVLASVCTGLVNAITITEFTWTVALCCLVWKTLLPFTHPLPLSLSLSASSFAVTPEPWEEGMWYRCPVFLKVALILISHFILILEFHPSLYTCVSLGTDLSIVLISLKDSSLCWLTSVIFPFSVLMISAMIFVICFFVCWFESILFFFEFLGVGRWLLSDFFCLSAIFLLVLLYLYVTYLGCLTFNSVFKHLRQVMFGDVLFNGQVFGDFHLFIGLLD